MRRELAVDQRHTGALLLAGLIALTGTCLAGALVVALLLRVAGHPVLTLCLFLPAVFLVLLVGSFLLHWGEHNLPRLWPSGSRLLLDGAALTLERRDTLLCQIRWDEPFTALRWRVRQIEGVHDSNWLCLACQLEQDEHAICVYTDASSQDWRRVPGWKQFPLLEGAPHPAQGAFLRIPLARSRAAPSRYNFGSLPQADPKILWPAEHRRRRQGWSLSFEDFGAVVAAVERCIDHSRD